jgi:ADP-heptose:LPS heptosyltransferase/lauroyl/myristoyl acyltransferase
LEIIRRHAASRPPSAQPPARQPGRAQHQDPVLLPLIKLAGWLVARTPEPLLQALAIGLGDFIFFCLPRRRRLILSNLHHAFPGRPARWHRSIGRESCRRLIETGLLSLATPFLGNERQRQIISGLPGLLAALAEHEANPAPTLICSPHIAYWEAQTAMALVIPTPLPEFGTIFRPLKNAAINAFVQASRERHGLKLLSRKEGFAEALKILRRRGFVGVLFDQNAGLQGALTTLFGRVCSTTELPGLMAEKFDARVYGIHAVRRGFWRVAIDLQRIESDGTSAGVTIALNRWLEDLLRRDDNLCASWLWAHDRWRNQDLPPRRLRLEAKRDLLSTELSLRRLAAHPRGTRIWIRLPNWLGDVVMALPLIRALRRSRPDAEITLVVQPRFAPLLKELQVADHLFTVPPRGLQGLAAFRRAGAAFPDVWILFTNSFRGDLEAWLSGCRQRFGILRRGRPRPLLTHAYSVPPEFDERAHHQLQLWDDFLRHFGLASPPDRTPLALPNPVEPISARPGPAPIGLIPGSENNPEKRWPVEHWRALIKSLPDGNFVIFGAASDAAIAGAVAAGFGESRVENIAGRTDLVGFARRLCSCRLLVTNDTGGMHLANALGVPLVALFGPTNPVRTGPVFDDGQAPGAVPSFRIVQPPGCPPSGGASLAGLDPSVVVAHIRELLSARGGRL